MDKEYMAHSGVKGMKWGVWNAETKAKYFGRGKGRASNPKKATKERLKERKKAEAYSSLLSDKELDKRIKRLEKEKRLRELTESEIKAGKKTTNSFLSEHGKTIAKVVVAAAAAELGRQVISSSKTKREARESFMKNKYSENLKKNDELAVKMINKVGSKASSVGKNIASGNGIVQVGTSRPSDKTLAYKTGRAIGKVIDAAANTKATYNAQKGKHVRW